MRAVSSTGFRGAVVLLSVPLIILTVSGAHAAQLPAPSPQTAAAEQTPSPNPTQPETQPDLKVDRDPILAPFVPPKPASSTSGAASPSPAPNTASTEGSELKKSKSGVYTLSENVNEVLLNCAVIDDKGNLVTTLDRGDFRVWEDGVPQKIDLFRKQDLPTSIGILVDNSGSMRDKRSAVETAALDLMRASNPHDSAFIVNFSDRAYLDQGFTSNISLLQKGLSRFDAKGTTAIYDAVAASADELSQHSSLPKQVLLVITDGADNASRLTLAQAVRRVQGLGGPVVYSIGLLYGVDDSDAKQARAALESLSSDTGGIAYFPSSLEQVDRIALEIARDIREQYTIGYHPTRPDALGGYRTVRVEAQAPGFKNLSVRTRKGYYAKPAASRPAARSTAEANTQPRR